MKKDEHHYCTVYDEKEKRRKLGPEAAPELVAATETMSLDNVNLPA
jgi:hypothetical protein